MYGFDASPTTKIAEIALVYQSLSQPPPGWIIMENNKKCSKKTKSMLNEEVHHNRKENSRTMCGESIIYTLAFGAVQIVGV